MSDFNQFKSNTDFASRAYSTITVAGTEPVTGSEMQFTLTGVRNGTITPHASLNGIIPLVYKLDFRIVGLTLFVDYPLFAGDTIKIVY